MRLTERKTVYPRCDKQGNLTKVDCIEIKNKGLAEEKLCQLEDIEYELGIDLLTLFKALKNGIWLKNKDKSIEHKFVILRCYTDKFYLIYNEGCNDFSYYGKTWALTKKELEGDKK